MTLVAVTRSLRCSAVCSSHLLKALAYLMFSHLFTILYALIAFVFDLEYCWYHVSHAADIAPLLHRSNTRVDKCFRRTRCTCSPYHVSQACPIAWFCHRRHTLDPIIRIRFPSITREVHVLHAAYIDFWAHRIAAFFATRLRRTSPHHLPHADA